jgi:sulfur carrier protein ThiS
MGELRTPPPTPGRCRVLVEVARGAAGTQRPMEVEPGTPIRGLVRALGFSPEGVAVLVDGRPVPLDGPLEDGQRLVIVPTFSGG